MKLSKRAGKRYDEILEEDSGNMEDHIDIIGEAKDPVKPAKEKDAESKAIKTGLYGPTQFSEEDMRAVGKELEREQSGDRNRESVEQDTSQWCSQCQVIFIIIVITIIIIIIIIIITTIY